MIVSTIEDDGTETPLSPEEARRLNKLAGLTDVDQNFIRAIESGEITGDCIEVDDDYVPPSPPACLRCKYFIDDENAPLDAIERCAAFPDGIPNEIYDEGNPHVEPFPGDHGLQFEPRDEDKPIILPFPGRQSE